MDERSAAARARLLAEDDATAAKFFTETLPAIREQADLSAEDASFVALLSWTLAQTPPIATAAECDAYVKRVADILGPIGWPNISAEAWEAFIRTREGAIACALGRRIQDWRGEALETD